MNQLLHRLPIRYLYFGVVALFSICLFIVTFWTAHHFTTQAIVRTTVSYQEEMLVELNRRLAEQLNYMESISLAISGNSDIVELLSEDQSSYEQYALYQRASSTLLGLVFSSPWVNSIHLYMPSPLASIYPVEYYSFEEWFKTPWHEQLQQNDFIWIGERTLSTPTGPSSVVSFARSLTSLSGEPSGVAIINVNSDMLQKLIGDSERSSTRLVINSSGDKIIQSGYMDYPLEEEDLIRISEGRHALHSGLNTLSERWKLSSGMAQVVISKVSDSGWLIVEITPWSELTKDSDVMLKVLSIIAIASILILLLIHILLHDIFTKPIFLLLRHMNRYPDISIKMNDDYHNEFGQLFAGYNRLIMRIKELYQSLDDQHKKKRETEIRSLQAMINPHFLYNTLDQLNWMAIKDGNSKMSKVLEMTGGLLRIGLSDGEPLIELSQELKFIEYYVQIQQIRLGEKNICFKITADESLLTMLVPKMTLQPFIENSIKHGLHGRDHGCIEVRVDCIHNNQLRMVITDDGRGLSRATFIGRKTPGGYGIGNVRARLDAFFHSDYRIDLTEPEHGGTEVTIVIPLIHSNEENSDGRNV